MASFIRYAIAEVTPDGPKGAEIGKVWGWEKQIDLDQGRALYRLTLSTAQYRTLQDSTDMLLFPAFNTPASRLPAELRVALASYNVTPEAEDTVLNLLRALRDRAGLTFREVDFSVKE